MPNDYEKAQAAIKGQRDAENSKKDGVLYTVLHNPYKPPKDQTLKAYYDDGWKKGKGK